MKNRFWESTAAGISSFIPKIARDISKMSGPVTPTNGDGLFDPAAGFDKVHNLYQNNFGAALLF